jgi:hypothetical protein
MTIGRPVQSQTTDVLTTLALPLHAVYSLASRIFYDL